jgi:hypothetical protein
MDHKLTPKCGNPECRGCMICNTRSCTVCGLTDASLTTDCCIEQVSAVGQAKICEGKLDYRAGAWVAAMNPAQQEMEKLRQVNRNANRGGHGGAYR